MSKPNSWQVLVPISSNLFKGDIIKYIEVTRLNVPTGRELLGKILSVGSGDMVVNNGSLTYVYCNRIV
jgi:hypothetical protein